MSQTEGNLANVPAILSHQGAPRKRGGNSTVVMVAWQGEPRGWEGRAGPGGATLSFLWRLLAGFFRSEKAAPQPPL